MNILYISNEYKDPKTGGELVTNTIKKILSTAPDLKVYLYPISGYKPLRTLAPHIDNDVSRNECSKITSFARESRCDYVAINGSLNGNLIQTLHKNKIKTIAIFHNIDYAYMWKKIRSGSYIDLFRLFQTRLKEQLTYKYATRLVFFNPRDELVASDIYKTCSPMGSAHICPLPLIDRFDTNRITSVASNPKEMIFIGSAFYANIEAIKYFISNVIDSVPYDLNIVGRGFEEEMFKHPRVRITGEVDDVSEYYYADNIIINPVQSGSGMKTKTIEAFMFGREVVGSAEAFSGIDLYKYNFIRACHSPHDYVAQILNYNCAFQERIRDVYLDNSSPRAFLEAFKNCL